MTGSKCSLTPRVFLLNVPSSVYLWEKIPKEGYPSIKERRNDPPPFLKYGFNYFLPNSIVKKRRKGQRLTEEKDGKQHLERQIQGQHPKWQVTSISGPAVMREILYVYGLSPQCPKYYSNYEESRGTRLVARLAEGSVSGIRPWVQCLALHQFKGGSVCLWPQRQGAAGRKIWSSSA